MLLKSERWEATTSIYTLTSTGEVESNPLPLFGLGAKVARRRKLSNRVGSGSAPAASTKPQIPKAGRARPSPAESPATRTASITSTEALR